MNQRGGPAATPGPFGFHSRAGREAYYLVKS